LTTQQSLRPIILIIGGAKRVGRACVLEMARRNCDVVFTYSQSEQDAEETAHLVRTLSAEGAESGRAWTFRLKLDDQAALGQSLKLLAHSQPRFDGLICCASTYETSPLESITLDRLHHDFQINAASYALIIQALREPLLRSILPQSRSITPGIVTFGDLHAMGTQGQPRKNMLSYAMSKAALLELSLAAARELAPHIRVNSIAPGVIAWPESGPDADLAMQQAYLKRVPLARAGTPEEAANAAAWLLLEASYCTGQVLHLDGGRSIT
jgi:pteridine reductase